MKTVWSLFQKERTKNYSLMSPDGMTLVVSAVSMGTAAYSRQTTWRKTEGGHLLTTLTDTQTSSSVLFKYLHVRGRHRRRPGNNWNHYLKSRKGLPNYGRRFTVEHQRRMAILHMIERLLYYT